MKKTLLLAVAASVYTFVNAQDVIVMKNGDAILSKVQKITQTEIEYKKFSHLDGPVYTVAKSSVVSINYQNGEKEIIKAEEQNNAEQSAATSSPKDVPAFGEPDEERNKELMAAINNNNLKYTGNKKGKNAVYAVFQLNATENSILANKDIEISFVTGSSVKRFKKKPREFFENNFDGSVRPAFSYDDPYMKMYITNRTNKTIFIDLANTFFIRQGEATPYYVPSSTSSTSGGSSGVGVNLGGITGALGVGGALGSLASGVTVGGSSSSASTTTTYAQRIVSIPPMSKKELDPQFFFPTIKTYSNILYAKRNKYGGWGSYSVDFKQEDFKTGDEIIWTEATSPLKFGKFITYSFYENMHSVQTIKAVFYIQKALGFRGFKCLTYSEGTIAFTGLVD